MSNPFVFTLSNGTPVQPAFPGYLALALTENTELNWPWVDQDTALAVPFWLDVTPTGAFSITLPSAQAASPGQAIIIFNVGADTINILGNDGASITTVASGIGKYLLLRDNATVGGTWRVITFGAGTSQSDASALAGYGLSASGAQLQTNDPSVTLLSSYSVEATDRASMFVVNSSVGAGTLSFDAAATLGNGFWVGFANLGTGAWTIDPNAGELIDNQPTLTLNPNESCFIICNGVGFTTYGRGRPVTFVSTALVKSVAGSSNVTLNNTEAANTQIKFTGLLTGNIEVIFPSVVGEWYINNATTGGFSITAKTSGGSGVVCPESQQIVIKGDGTDILSAFTVIPTGSISMADGTISAPGLGFTLEPTTGFSRPNPGQMSISVLAAEVFRFTSSLVQSLLAFTVKLSDNGAGIGPVFTMWRSSNSPAASDAIGTANFDGMNSAAAQTTYAALRATILDPTNASEDGTLDAYVVGAGALSKTLSISLGSVTETLADDGAAAGPSFTLYRNSASPAGSDLLGAFKIDGKDSIGTTTTYAAAAARINSSVDGGESAAWFWSLMNSGTFRETMSLSAASGRVTAQITDYGAGFANGPLLTLMRDSASPAANDALAEIEFPGRSSTGAVTTYAYILGRIIDPTNASPDGNLELGSMVNGSGTPQLYISNGVYTEGAVGAGIGTGTINATGLYQNGVKQGGWTSFTPVLAFGGGSVGITYGTRTGQYMMVGDTLFYQVAITLTNKGSSVGNATISGLPTNDATGICVGNLLGSIGITGFTSPYCRVGAGTSVIVLANQTATGGSAFAETNFSNTSSIFLSGFYSV
jgi:hypothetical protein